MTGYGTPAAAGPPQQGTSFSADWRDWLRLIGGVLFASGAVVLAIRKEAWSAGALLLVFAVPCVVLYVLALRGRRESPGLEGWQSAYVTFAALLLPVALLQLVDALGGNVNARLIIALVFAVSAAVAAFVALYAAAWWQMLIGGLYAIVAWLAFWGKVLDEPSADTIRVLLLLAAAILLGLALVLGRRERPGSSDLITVAGIAAILAGAISLAGLSSAFGDVANTVSSDVPAPSQGWNIYMLLVSLVLIGYGAKSRTRGPGYVGAVGLLVFIGLVGANVVTLLEGGDRTDIVGWPLVLLIGGIAAIVAGFAMSDGGGGVGAQADYGLPGGGPGGGQPGGAGYAPDPGYGQTAVRPTQPGPPPPPGGGGGAPTQAPPGPAPGGPPAGGDQPTQQRPLPPQPGQ
jgi:hypothetical protein